MPRPSRTTCASPSALNAGDLIDRALSRADFRAFLSAGDAEGLGLACQPMPDSDYAGRGDGALLGWADVPPEWQTAPPARPAKCAAPRNPPPADIRVGPAVDWSWAPGPVSPASRGVCASGRRRSGAWGPSAAPDGGVGPSPAVPVSEHDTPGRTPGHCAARAEVKAATVWVWSRRPLPKGSADRP